MNNKLRQSGLSLIEMSVIIAVIALLVSLSVPAVRAFMKSFETEAGARSMISAALSSARTISLREQKYAGIRFQNAYNPESAHKASQYMIFIIQDPEIMAYGFRVVEGQKPIKLPDSVGVMDLIIVYGRNEINPVSPGDEYKLEDASITPDQKDELLGNFVTFTDMSTFSIVFSPAGKLTIHGIRVRNKDGYIDTNSNTSNISYDDVFNKKGQVDTNVGMFYQDDYFGKLDNPYGNLGLGPEPSRSSFIIYDKNEFKRANEKGKAWSDYLVRVVADRIYINSYMGTIVSRD